MTTEIALDENNPYEIAARIVDAEELGALALVQSHMRAGNRAGALMMQQVAITLEATAYKIRMRGANYSAVVHDFSQPEKE